MLTTRIPKTTLVFLCLGLAVQDGFAAIRATKIVNEQGRQINGGLLGKITQWLPEETWKKAAIAAAVIGVPAVLLIGGGMWRHFKKRKGGITDAEKRRKEQSRAAGDASGVPDLSEENQSQDLANKVGDPKKDAVDEKNLAAQPQNSGQVVPAESSPVQVQERQEDAVNPSQEPKAAGVNGGATASAGRGQKKPLTRNDEVQQPRDTLKDIVNDDSLSADKKLEKIFGQSCPATMTYDEFHEKQNQAIADVADKACQEISEKTNLDPMQKLIGMQGLLREAPNYLKSRYEKYLNKNVVEAAKEVAKAMDKNPDLTTMQKHNEMYSLLSREFNDTDEVRRQVIDPLRQRVYNELNDFSRYLTVDEYLSALQNFDGVQNTFMGATVHSQSFSKACNFISDGRDPLPEGYLKHQKKFDFRMKALMSDKFDSSWLSRDFALHGTPAECQNRLIGKQLNTLATVCGLAKGTPEQQSVEAAALGTLQACTQLPKGLRFNSSGQEDKSVEAANKKDIREYVAYNEEGLREFYNLPENIRNAFADICGPFPPCPADEPEEEQ